jgi:hypothetical protein
MEIIKVRSISRYVFKRHIEIPSNGVEHYWDDTPQQNLLTQIFETRGLG